VPDRDPAVAGGDPVGLPAGDRLRGDRAELERAELRQHMLIQQLHVVQPRLEREVGGVRRCPGRVDVAKQGDSPAVHRHECPELLTPPDLRSKRDRIALAVERLRSISIALPPAHLPAHRPALEDTLLDLHRLQDLTTAGWCSTSCPVSALARARTSPPAPPPPPIKSHESDYPHSTLRSTWGAGSRTRG
jgi:hypothetical protein